MSRKTNKGTTKRRLLMDPKVWVLKVPLLLMFGEFISHCYSFSTGESTITANQSLVDGHFLVSHGGIFALGFFRPGNSGRRYVGIWFNKDPKRSVVWVANRDNPIRDACGILSFDATQNLVLNCNSSKNTTPIWSTHIARPTKGGIPNHSSVMAKLLETGNFVLLRQETQNMIWQSFDYPTHTQLPHMKVGYDPHTGVNRTLTSWKSEDDPGTGSCSYGLDPTGVPQMIVNKGSNRVWRGGPWNGLGWSGIPEMNKNVVFDFRYLETPDEISYMYNYKANYPSFASRITVNETGFLQQFGSRPGDPEWYLIWISPKDRCDPYGRCGAYSYCNPNVIMSDFECKCLPGFRPRSIQDWERKEGKGGCVRERGQDPAAACGNGARFETIHNVKVPDTNVARKNMSLSGKACEQECLQDCTCVAYTSANLSLEASKSGCITWHGDLVDIKLYSNYGGQDLHVKVDAVEFEKARKRPKGLHGAKRLWVMVTLPVFLTALILLLCYRISKLRGHAERRNHKILLLEDHKMINLPFFNMREMKSATANFSNKLGQGGFGPVFKGQLPNGQEIAVKRLSKHSCQGAEEFKNEVMLIARLQHRNLVKLLGCCIDEEETMLIYEYMPNKSLDSFIFDDSKKVLLDWNRRYEIIIGIARGILYLHQDSRLKIVHRDLKTSNILLDAEMNPKISDFGMARIFGGNQSQANTNRIVGTFGYMSPEYALDGLFSVKSDVFSFGVILLEIIIGKKNHFLYSDNPLSNLIRHIWDLWKEGRALEIVDASMGDSWQEVKVLRCIQIGLLCVQENATDRPTMSTVVVMLSNEFVLPSPKQPTFAVRRTSRDNTTYSSSTLCSNNDMTVSIVEPR